MERSKPKIRRCAIYTRKSSEEGLEQEFNSCPARGLRSLHQKPSRGGLASNQSSLR
jgi:hypothetical protein